MDNDLLIQLRVADQFFNVLKLQGKEAIAQPFCFNIDILSADELAPHQFILQPAQLSLLSRTKTIHRTWLGLITKTQAQPTNKQGELQLSLVFESRLSLLKQQHQVRILQNQSIINIVTQILLSHGYRESQLKFHLIREYPPQDYLLQVFEETDFDFIQRLLARSGIFYWCEVDHEQEILHFCDDNLFSPHLNHQVIYIPTSGMDQEICLDKMQILMSQSLPWVRVVDHNEMHPSMAIDIAHRRQQSDGGITHYGLGALYPEEATRIAQLQWEQQEQETQIIAEGTIPSLASGYTATLMGERFSQTLSGDYLIIEIEHHGQQVIEQQGDSLAYRNRIVLLPRACPYRSPILGHPELPATFSARVESNGSAPLLDEQGRYRLRAHFDLSDALPAQASPPLPRLSPYGGQLNDDRQSTGIHTPLLDGAEVLVACLQGDPNRPIILGTLANAQNINPVSSANKMQNRFISAGDNELLMDDSFEQTKIILRTRQNQNRLELNAKENHHHIDLISQQGDIYWQAGKIVALQCDDSTQEIIGKDRIHIITKNYQLKTQKQDIQQQAATSYELQAKKNISVINRENIEISSNNHFQVNALKDNQALFEGDVSFIAENGNIHLQAANSINIMGNGSGDMEFRQGTAGFKITANGQIILFGNSVSLSGSISLQGSVNYFPNPIPPPLPLPIPQPPPPRPIADLKPQNNTIKVIDDILTLNLTNDATKDKPANFTFLTNARYRIISYSKDLFVNTFTGMVKNSQIIIENIDLTEPFTVELSDNATRQAIYIAAQDNKPCSITSCLKILSNPRATKETVDATIPNKTRRTRSVCLTIIPAALVFNFRVETMELFQALCAKANVELNPAMISQVKDHLSYFQTESTAEDTCRRSAFTPDEIDYIKNNGNNIVLFIHGYNVAYGSYGKEFVVEPEAMIKDFGEKDTALYRDLTQDIPVAYGNGFAWLMHNAPADQGKLTLNGKGVHEWQVCMSYNLNQATNQLKNGDYSKYSHIVSIAWQGDPVYPYDYIAAIPLTKPTGHLVSKLIEPLLKEGIEVNIIAHSLGCLVLMNALENLANAGQSIHHAFLWQAAIPDNAFTTTTPADKFNNAHYFFPQAHRGARKVTVLFSQDDTILGPLPYQKFSEIQHALQQKLLDPSIPPILACLAVVLHYLDNHTTFNRIRSIYHVANMIGVPLSFLYANEKNRENFYQEWHQEHLVSIQERFFEPILNAQVTRVKQEHSRLFHDLSMLFKIDMESSLDREHDIVSYFQEKLTAVVDQWGFYTELKEILWNRWTVDRQSPASDQMAGLILTIFLSKNAEPRSAMGYSGPNTTDKFTQDLVNKQKIIPAPQRPWLIDHSSMRIPSKDLMEHVYKHWIINASYGIKKFGQYQIS